MDIILNNSYSNIISLGIVAIVLLFIKNKVINFVLAISEKTSTVYDELLLHSIKTPSTYLIVIGYLLISISYFIQEDIINFNYSLSSSVFLLFIIVISWSLLRGLNFYIATKPFLQKLTSEDDATLVTETYEIVIRILKVIIVVLTLLIIMQELGLSVSGLLAFGGVGGLIVGLAAKDLLSNFFEHSTINPDNHLNSSCLFFK